MSNETKSIKFDIKAEDEDDKFMRFTGNGSPFDGKSDLGGDVVIEGAFKRSLDQKGDTRVLLWHHDTREPIGTVKLEETKDGLMITEGLINKTIQRGAEVAELIAMGAVKGLSIGYRAVKTGFKNGDRLLKEIALFEMSLVPFPMNEGAGVTSAKGDDGEISFEKALCVVKEKIGEAKASSFGLINETVKNLNALLMKDFKLDDSKNSNDEDQESELSDDNAEEKNKELIAELKIILQGINK